MTIPANKPADPVASAAQGIAAGKAAATAGNGSAERSDFPVSAAQERFWLLDRLDPGNASYNVAVRWRLQGAILTDVLQASWNTIIERHEILRSIFPEVDGAPIQRVLPQGQFCLKEIDLGKLSADQQDAEGDRIGIIEARAPFDLASGPLIRATLLRFSPTVSILLVTTHQIVSDGWSIGVMAREMGVIYEALRRNAPSGLEPLPIQYADYSLWQLEWLRVRGTEAETLYWTRQLAGVKPFKVIPDHPRPAMPTTNGAIVSRVLPRELTKRAQTLSTESGATLFATALATLCATLSRFTSQTEIVIGTQVSDRDQVELEPMIGQFVNSLILRNHLDGNPRFTELVTRIRETVTQALDHRHIPIEQLLGMVKGERHVNSPPISVNFIFQKTFIQNAVYADFELIDMPSLPAGSIYDLNFFMIERADGWRVSCQYNTDQFEASTAERLLEYFQNVLESATTDAGRRLSELTLKGPGESRVLFGKLNDTRTLYPRDLTLTKLFEAQAQRSPDAVALSFDNSQVTFAEVNSSANRLAAYLREQGHLPGSRIGVCLRAGMELTICLLAVLKIGAVFIPLDPGEPTTRLSVLIDAASAGALLGRNLRRTGNKTLKLIDIDSALGAAPPANDSTAPVAVDAASPACMLFAADSVGEPHIVNLSHRSLSNLIYSIAKQPGVGDRDVVVATSPTGLDSGLFEILLPLLTGARLVIATEKQLSHGRALLQFLQHSGATVMYGGPQVWNRLLDAEWIGFPSLKMLCRGLDTSPMLMDRLIATGGELWELYGHPEAGIWSAIRHVKTRSERGMLAPIANTSLHILDSTLQPTSVGMTGEVYISGDGIAAGLSANAFRNIAGTSMFRTGDTGRLLASGQIELLGRIDARFFHEDRQIDPAWIERVLLRRPDVADAAVSRMQSSMDQTSIAAFVKPRQPPNDEQAWLLELRRSAAEHLPAYLAPDSFFICESIQHDGLHAVQRPRGSSRPSGETEQRLAEIWTAMLGVSAVDATDNFFELGGHSLLAARMLTQIERVFGRRIKLATLFMAPTLRDLANLLSQETSRDFDFRQVVKIQPHGSKRPLIAINNTGIYYGLAKNLGADQPVYSLQLFDPSVKHTTLPGTLEEIATGYVDLIRRVCPEGPYDLMGWCVAGALTFEIACQLTEQKQQVSHLILIDSWVPGYLRRLPKVQAFVADYSLRVQLIFAEWRRVLAGQTSMAAFVSHRHLVKKLRRMFAGSSPHLSENAIDGSGTPESYDRWLLAYLQTNADRYSPKQFPGKMHLVRSREEPTGWFFQEHAGWMPYTRSGIDVTFVDGDHFTIFQDRGAAQMAAQVSRALNRT